MVFFDKYKKTKKVPKSYAEDKILASFMKKVHKINVISPLYTRASIFNKTLEYAIKESKKVLYIINKDIEAIDIGQSIVNYIDKPSCVAETKKINICNHSVAVYLEEKFDLVIYDEINSRPIYTKESIGKLVSSLSCAYGTIITYSMEVILKGGSVIYNLKNSLDIPIVEPRFILTRIKLEEEIPSAVYDYLKWSINSNNKVIIYVPQTEQVDKIYNSINAIKDNLTSNIYIVKTTENNKKRFVKFLLADKGILITDNYNEDYIGLKPVNIMVFFSDSNSFTYKDLVYISCRVNRVLKNSKEEVMFICNSESESMDRCKKILRELNKKAWEAGCFEK